MNYKSLIDTMYEAHQTEMTQAVKDVRARLQQWKDYQATMPPTALTAPINKAQRYADSIENKTRKRTDLEIQLRYETFENERDVNIPSFME